MIQPGLPHRQQGFTIVELLISTMVFSMVLIVIAVGVMSFTRSYYRGIHQAKTQNTARTILETVTQAIQLSGDKVTSPGIANGNSLSMCIGDQHFSFVLRKQLWEGAAPGPNQSRHALVLNRGTLCETTPAQSMAAADPDGTELLLPGMRLAKFDVAQIGTTNTYRTTIRVVFGDDDLLCSPAAGDCDNGNTSTNLNAPDLACKASMRGSEYCAQSELTTVVRQRITR